MKKNFLLLVPDFKVHPPPITTDKTPGHVRTPSSGSAGESTGTFTASVTSPALSPGSPSHSRNSSAEATTAQNQYDDF